MSNRMLDLTVPALRYAAELCKLYPDYRIGVVVPTAEDATKALDGLTDFVDWTQMVKINTDHPRYVFWKNNSRADFVAIDESMNGYNWNLLLVDPTIEKRKANNIMRHYVTRLF